MAPTCFIIMPISTPEPMLSKYHDGKEHFAHVLEYLFTPAIEKAGLEPIGPLADGAELIHARIIEKLNTADLVLCDMSCLNANVFFELGIRTALNKAVSLVHDEQTSKIPFDTATVNRQMYSSGLEAWVLEDQINALSAHVAACSKQGTDNAMWKHFGLRTRVQPRLDTTPKSDDKLDLLSLEVAGLKKELARLVRRSAPPAPSECNALRLVPTGDTPPPEAMESFTDDMLKLGDVRETRTHSSGRIDVITSSTLPLEVRKRAVDFGVEHEMLLELYRD